VAGPYPPSSGWDWRGDWCRGRSLHSHEESRQLPQQWLLQQQVLDSQSNAYQVIVDILLFTWGVFCSSYSIQQSFYFKQVNATQCSGIAFYLKSDPGPGSQINTGPCGSGTWLEFVVTKSCFDMEKLYFMVV
jgi:hypothetical protein